MAKTRENLWFDFRLQLIEKQRKERNAAYIVSFRYKAPLSVAQYE
jgi:hypothetical protein